MLPMIVAPAGNWASLVAAVESGADAVYFGSDTFSMRAFAGNFSLEEISEVASYCHKREVKAYLAVNTIIMQDGLNRVKNLLFEAGKAKVDAIIAFDMAVVNQAKELGLNIHLSTQASVSNAEAAIAYYRMGIKRIVLARECSLRDLRDITAEIKRQGINLEIEAFAHGAMCLSVSGRCFMSLYSDMRSANRGMCAQPCRRQYKITALDGSAEFFVGEDYVLSPKDLCSITFLDELIKTGISAIKIEGRMRPAEYVRDVVGAYREALGLISEGAFSKENKERLLKKVKSAYNRGLSTGFYFGSPDKEISRAWQKGYDKQLVGEVVKIFPKIGVAEIALSNRGVSKGDELLFIGRRTGAKQAKIFSMQINKQDIDTASKKSHVGVKLPFKVFPKDKVYKISRKKP